MNFVKAIIEKIILIAKFIYRTFIAFFRPFLKILGAIASYCYSACDYFVMTVVNFSGGVIDAFHEAATSPRQKRIAKITIITLSSLIGIFLIAIILVECFIIVPIGNSAVITRFGKYDREVEAGLRLRVPFIEKFFIVNSENLMEETFGFIQVKPPIKDSEITDEERRIQDNYETELKKSEQDSVGVFSSAGNVLDALGKKQRLTYDYIRSKYTDNDKSLHTIMRMLNRNKYEVKHVKAIGVSLSGRIPLEEESRLITGDLNIIHLTWTLQYKINDSKNYLFNSRDVQRNVRDIGKAVMSSVIGASLYKKIISTDRQAIESEVTSKIQKVVDQYKLGIKITQVIILDAIPVKEVISAFNEVNRAAQDMEKDIYNAEREYSAAIPQSYGEAQNIIANAEAKAIQIVNQATGEAGWFDRIVDEYQKAPDITKDRLYLEAMASVFDQTPNAIVDKNVQGVLPIILGSGLSQLKNNIGMPAPAPTTIKIQLPEGTTTNNIKTTSSAYQSKITTGNMAKPAANNPTGKITPKPVDAAKKSPSIANTAPPGSI